MPCAIDGSDAPAVFSTPHHVHYGSSRASQRKRVLNGSEEERIRLHCVLWVAKVYRPAQ